MKSSIMEGIQDDLSYMKQEHYLESVTKPLKGHYHDIIKLTGEDTDRDGLIKTPERAAKAMQFLTQGYQLDGSEILKSAMFKEKYSEMVIVKDIELYSLCEHHVLPFIGRAHVAYLPRGKVIGLSKIARIVDMFARRLQIQENLTVQIADAIRDVIQPAGVAVTIEAEHLCMKMRGVEKQNSTMKTSVMLGTFRESQATRMEYLQLIAD